jgi:Tfp pilus assembly protein PilF
MKKLVLTTSLFITFISVYSQDRFLQDNVYKPTLIPEARELYNEGTTALENKKYTIAIQKLRKVISLDPNFTDSYDNIAVCFRRTNQLDSAIFYYNKSLKLYPKNRLALNNLGVAYLQNKQFDNAEETYKKSLLLNSNSIETDEAEIEYNGEPYYGLCRTYFYQNKYELAVVNGNQAYELWKVKLPLYASDALYIVGLSYINKGDRKKGIIALKESSSLGNQYAKEALKDL